MLLTSGPLVSETESSLGENGRELFYLIQVSDLQCDLQIFVVISQNLGAYTRH